MKWNFAFTSQGCQLAARSLKLYVLAKLRSIHSCQNGTCEDYYQIDSLTTWTQKRNLTFHPINPPLQPRLKCLTNTRSQQSVYSKICHSNEVQLTAVKLQHPLTIITWPYRGSGIGPLSLSFLKLSTDKLLLFKWLQAQVQFF